MNFGWKTRVGLVLSAVWLCLVFLGSDEYHRSGQVLGIGMLPLVLIWGGVWAVAGWRAQRPAKPQISEEVLAEVKRKRTSEIRTIFAVTLICTVGILAATWQLRASGSEADTPSISRWLGEWLIYGLVAYFIFRAIPRQSAGLAAILASLVIVGGVNYRAYASVAEQRQAIDSLAKATPLFNKIQAGNPVTEEEVRNAHIGLFEPLVLAQATFGREVLAITTTYEKTVAALQPELMLTPASLAAPGIRAQTRAKLVAWQAATTSYKSQMERAIARGRVAIQAAQIQMPAAVSDSPSRGFDESSAQLSSYLVSLVATERDASNAVAALLDLMDANPGGYIVDRGPLPNLLFREETVLAQYRDLMSTVLAASQRQEEGRAKLNEAQADRNQKLENLLRR